MEEVRGHKHRLRTPAGDKGGVKGKGCGHGVEQVTSPARSQGVTGEAEGAGGRTEGAGEGAREEGLMDGSAS
jgi:hypothetical protein